MKKVIVGAAACACCVASAEFVHELDHKDRSKLPLTCVDEDSSRHCSLQRSVDDNSDIDIKGLIEEQFPLFFQLDSSNYDEDSDVFKDKLLQDYVYGGGKGGWKATWSKSI